MRSVAVIAGLAAAVLASPAPVATATGASSSCASSYNGAFEIEIVNATTSKRDLEKRTALMLTLNNGVLKDAEGRIGYIASNYQFQFDFQAQPQSIYDAGWAVCSNGTLVLGATAEFQKCLSGMFYNLYDGNTAAQCSNIYIQVASTGGVSQIGDGQVTANPTVTQITDGQIQGPTGAVSQITDGQIQAPTGVVSQITDGQIQAPTGVVSQISDGQIQAPTATGAPVSQITDGQIQAPTGAPVSQISDGQIQAPTNGTTPKSPAVTSPAAYTGAAALPTAQAFVGLAAGVLAVAML